MGFFSKITRPFKKAANKIIKPFQKVSDKLIPNELRPLLPYASMFIPGSGILSGLGGAGRFASMYGTNMLTQAMADPEADFEDLNQLSGILSGGQGYLSGANTGANLRDSATFGSGAEQGPMTVAQNSALNDRSFLTKASDLGKNVAATGADYFKGNMETLQDLGSGASRLNLPNLKEGLGAIAFDASKATGDVAVNYQRPAMREFEKQEAADAAEIEATSTANDSERAYQQMTMMRQAGIPEDTVEETLQMNDLSEYYEAPETAAYGGIMGRSDYEFGGITEALNNAGARGLTTDNNMGGVMNGYNMGGSVLPQGMEMDYRQGGFIPMGSKERADDVPARVSKNEFVMTADAVRAAGGGSVNEGAKKMYEIMNNLEARA